MRALRMGSQGARVKQWQTFLRGQGHAILVDGAFGKKTRGATLEFQAQHGLAVDGIAGNQTLGHAMRLGLRVVPSVLTGKSSPEWPPAPPGLRPLSAAARRRRFGRFQFESSPTPTNPEAIAITQRSNEFRIVRVALPQLVGVRGFPRSGKVFFHKSAADALVSLVGAWEQAGLLHLIQTWAGTYVPRFIRGSRTRLSQHAYGTAFDINAQWNRLGVTPALVGEKGSVRELVAPAIRHGFFWGGHFRRRPDGMHFEVGEKQW